MGQDNSNLSLYDRVRSVPENAQKPIAGGRLKGKTDINPMWRIKVLTEVFGMCGIGWYYEITEKRLEQGANGEIAGFVDINLYVLDPATKEWSKPIQGTGGHSFIQNEAKGLYTNDEVFKSALTDALSVACKALGIGADVYWESDRTKYDGAQGGGEAKAVEPRKTLTGALKKEAVQAGQKRELTKGFFTIEPQKERFAEWIHKASQGNPQFMVLDYVKQHYTLSPDMEELILDLYAQYVLKLQKQS